MLDWPADTLGALNKIGELRSLRNLVGHFAIRRFPTDDAFLFVGKSASDYKQIFGGEAQAGIMMTAVLEASVLHGMLDELKHMQNWVARAASDLAKDLEKERLIMR